MSYNPESVVKGDLLHLGEWLSEEMAYGHQKTNGYKEKFRRLEIDQTASDSVINFMGNYWRRFQTYAPLVIARPEDELAVLKTQQQLGKVANGLADKVGLMLWRANPVKDEYVQEAVDAVVEAAVSNPQRASSSQYIEALTMAQIDDNMLGRGIQQLHKAVTAPNFAPERAYNIALDTAVSGLFTWQAYMAQLRVNDIAPVLPEPGSSTNEIKVWQPVRH